jgi:hypothetical protein
MKGARLELLLTKYLGRGKGVHSLSNKYTPTITQYAMGAIYVLVWSIFGMPIFKIMVNCCDY